MKPEVTLKYLAYLRNKKQNNEGFTLIELLVVVIIIGVLAAVALPNLLNQVGKARETEIKNAAGTVTRTQQSYHFERRDFATDLNQMGLETAFANSDYLDPINNVTQGAGTANTEGVQVGATNITTLQGNDTATVITFNSDFKTDGTRAYSGRIEFEGISATYSQILCQTDSVTGPGITPTSTTQCETGSFVVK